MYFVIYIKKIIFDTIGIDNASYWPLTVRVSGFQK